ncbi:MAG: DNA translocase FtsK [Patescibacteria group bacterium]|nr:DNA translocase FtsK [Patescibacteria group bacterium]
MSRNGNGKKKGSGRMAPAPVAKQSEPRLHPDTKKSVWAIVFFCVAVVLALAGFEQAGPAGALIYQGLDALLGWGYFILPVTLVFAAVVFVFAERRRFVGMTLLGGGLLILSVLALIELAKPGKGGWLGLVLGSLRVPFGNIAAIIINGFVLVIAVLVTANVPLKFKWPSGEDDGEKEEFEAVGAEEDEGQQKAISKKQKGDDKGREPQKGPLQEVDVAEPDFEARPTKKLKPATFADYTPPPLSLLLTESSKPTTGDLLANANIIKRTLESFGIAVEMGEINVGPAVTRYTLKPAEGVKLSRITALNPDLALSLAAHPIRIEAPIPGKSLVGIEVPNKAAALVRLGSLMNYPDFQKSGPLGFVLGRDVSGEPVFASIEKMPHMLVAGATGSGKSILVHSVLTSLLYKNSPQTLKLILIDPKRVELSIYDGIPHLASPVITENKKAAGVFRWAISEMERRYELLQKAGSRDIKSYNASHGNEPLPFIVIAIDELADLMSSFGREVEGSIVRLAQMARATGIHLLLATQRPSVEVITGLIKANIPARVALQVASQIDSRTILDTPGAEKLLGHGDLLFLSAELSKPKRIQGAFITEEEIKKVTDFIRENNKEEIEAAKEEKVDFGGAGNQPPATGNQQSGPQNFEDFLNNEPNGDDDDLLEEALAVVLEAKKASASLLQRRLKVGYARAARLLDIMESQEFIGPGEGAKPRDVNVEKIEARLS